MRVGRWELSRRLGQGGMGEVWLGRDPTTGEEVAVKLLAPDALDPEGRLRFAREVEAMVRLRHPHVVRWLDSGQEGPRPWVAMEVCPGGTLAERVAKDGPLAPRAAVELIRDLAGALAAAHAAGVLHRDLKPHNVLFDRDGQARLADFGLARLVTYESLTETGAMIGSPGYLAPEQVRGDKQQFGPATDVWGLGAVLYFLLTGAAPFHRTSVMSSVKATLLDPAPAPSAKRPEVDARLDAIVRRCLEKSPTDRWPSALALRAALEGWLTGGSPTHESHRSRLVVGLLVAGALAAAGALAIAVVGPVPETLPPAPSDPSPLSSSPPTPSSNADRLLGEAWNAWRHADLYGTATRVDVLRRLESDHHRCEAWFLRALLLLSGGPSDALRDAAEQVLDASPPPERRAVATALIAFCDRDGPLVFQALEEAATTDPTWAVPRLLLGLMREAIGDLAGARAELDRALDLDADLVPALLQRSLISRQTKDPAAAHRDSKRAAELAPGCFFAWIELGTCLAELGRQAEAELALGRGLELEPGHMLGRGLRAIARRKQGNLTRALEDLDALLALQPDDPLWLFQRCEVRHAQGDLQGARADVDRALQVEPDLPEALQLRARVRLGQGDPAGALEDLWRAKNLLPPGSPDELKVVEEISRLETE